MSSLTTIKIKSMQLYFKYKDGCMTLQEYQEQIKPLDTAIDKLEVQALNHYLGDTSAFEISSSKHLH